MTKEEIEKRIREIEMRMLSNRIRIIQHNVKQGALKVALNSAYGAISSRKNPIGDDDLANAITVTGSTSIQYINKLAIEFVKKKRREYILKAIEEIDKLLAA